MGALVLGARKARINTRILPNMISGTPLTVEATKLEHDRPPTPNQRKKEHQHSSSYMQVPTFRSLLVVGPWNKNVRSLCVCGLFGC